MDLPALFVLPPGSASSKWEEFTLLSPPETIGSTGAALRIEAESPAKADVSDSLPEKVAAYAGLAVTAGEASGLLLTGAPDLREMRAAVLGVGLRGIPVYCLFPVSGEGKTPGGDSLLPCLLCLQELGIAGFGVSMRECPQESLVWFRELAPYAKIPLMADLPGTADWGSYYEAGVRVFVCGAPEARAAGAELSRLKTAQPGTLLSPPRPEDAPLLLCRGGSVYYLEEDFNATEPIPCEPDMSGGILGAEEYGGDLLLFHVKTVEDAEYLGGNLHMAHDAVGFLAESEEALESALLRYSGRALIDARSDVPEDRIRALAETYGAVVR